MTYDDTTYAVKVVVTDGGEGKLTVSELTYNGEASLPVFHNTYVKPAEPAEPDKPEIPQTGDATNTTLPAVLAVGGVALVAGTIAWTRRKNR